MKKFTILASAIILLIIAGFTGCVQLDTEEDINPGIGEDVGNNTPGDQRENQDGGSGPEDFLKGFVYARVDEPSSDFELEDLNGNKIKLSDLKGKIVFLNFWGTWCPPCREEMPHMQELYDEYKDQDVVILAVSPTSVELQGGRDSSRAEARVRNFIDGYGYTFPVLLDRDDKVWAVYQQRGIPANYIIDRQGIIRYLKLGAFEDKGEMEAFINAIDSMG